MAEFAQEDDLKHQLRVNLCDRAVAIRARRRWIEERWLHSRRTWMNIRHDMGYIPKVGRGYAIPSARRVLERTNVRIVKLLTPNVKWFEVSPMSDVSQEKLSNVDAFMWYVLRKRIKSRTNISQLARSMTLYGQAIIKTSISITNGQVWPTQRVVDPFSFYVFPETISNIDDAEVIFEDFLWSYEKYKSIAAKGIVDEIPYDQLGKPDWPYHLTERLAYQGITDPGNMSLAVERTARQLEQTTSAFVSVTEMWLKREDRLYQVYIAWNLKRGARIVGFFQSRYDAPLYRMSIHRPLPGETYTNSQMEDIEELDGLQQDQLNKFQDAVDWEQGFIIADASKRHDSWQMKGRALWYHDGDPQKEVQFVQTPQTSTNQLRAWQIYLAMQNSLGGAGTIAEGQPGRNMPRAGGAVNNLIDLGMSDIQDVAEVIEQEILTPALGDAYAVCHFMPDSQLVVIPGGKALYGGNDPSGNENPSMVLNKSAIQGDYEFEWIGSLQFQDESERAQRLMVFLNAAIQLQPMLQQQGYKLDLPELVQMVWRYGLGERGLSKVIKPMTPEEQKQLQMQMLQAAQQGGKSSSNGSNGSSFVNQPKASLR